MAVLTCHVLSSLGIMPLIPTNLGARNRVRCARMTAGDVGTNAGREEKLRAPFQTGR